MKTLCSEHDKVIRQCKCGSAMHAGTEYVSCPPRFFKVHEMEREEEEKLLADHHQAVLDSILEFD